jgi:hypothetical protein
MRRIALALLLCASCKDTISHIYAGRRYDPVGHCVDLTSSIDVVDGNDPGATCAPTCLLSPPTKTGETTVYVSRECPPYPPLFDTSGQSPTCADALRAYEAPIACIDGGIVIPDAGGGDAAHE